MWLGSMYVFFVKQKTAYEMRISDWSSDVCSSDLWGPVWWALVPRTWRVGQGPSWRLAEGFRSRRERRARSTVSLTDVAAVRICSPVTTGRLAAAIGSASWRASVCPYV